MKKAKYFFFVFVFILGVLALSNIYTIRENEFGYVTSLGKYKLTNESAGVYFKTPFIDRVQTLPKANMTYDIPPSEVLTGDKKTLVVDSFTLWKIEDVRLFMQKVGNVREAENRIESTVYNILKNKLSTKKQEDIINSNVDSVDLVNKEVSEQANSYLFKEYGIKILSTEIKRLDLPQANERAVFGRMISERAQMAEALRSEGKYEAEKIKNAVDKETSIIVSSAKAKAEEIIAQGEAEYMRILSSAYDETEEKEFYEFLRGLESAKVTMKGDKTVFLSPKSKLSEIVNK